MTVCNVSMMLLRDLYFPMNAMRVICTAIIKISQREAAKGRDNFSPTHWYMYGSKPTLNLQSIWQLLKNTLYATKITNVSKEAIPIRELNGLDANVHIHFDAPLASRICAYRLQVQACLKSKRMQLIERTCQIHYKKQQEYINILMLYFQGILVLGRMLKSLILQ